MSMTREQQREIGALKIATDRARGENLSTLAETIHASADLIDLLTVAGGLTFKDYPAKVRRRMATEGRARPSGAFPLADCSDAEDAIRSQGRAKPEDRGAVVAHIKKRVRALRCSGRIFEKYK